MEKVLYVNSHKSFNLIYKEILKNETDKLGNNEKLIVFKNQLLKLGFDDKGGLYVHIFDNKEKKFLTSFDKVKENINFRASLIAREYQADFKITTSNSGSHSNKKEKVSRLALGKNYFYIGKFDNSKLLTGEGTYVEKNYIAEGTFENGMLNGYGTIITPKKVDKGIFKDGEPATELISKNYKKAPVIRTIDLKYNKTKIKGAKLIVPRFSSKFKITNVKDYSKFLTPKNNLLTFNKKKEQNIIGIVDKNVTKDIYNTSEPKNYLFNDEENSRYKSVQYISEKEDLKDIVSNNVSTSSKDQKKSVKIVLYRHGNNGKKGRIKQTNINSFFLKALRDISFQIRDYNKLKENEKIEKIDITLNICYGEINLKGDNNLRKCLQDIMRLNPNLTMKITASEQTVSTVISGGKMYAPSLNDKGKIEYSVFKINKVEDFNDLDKVKKTREFDTLADFLDKNYKGIDQDKKRKYQNNRNNLLRNNKNMKKM